MATQATYVSAPGYPQSDGAKIEWVGVVTGINYTAGTAEVIEAAGCGMSHILHITGGMSTSKTYIVVGSTATTVTNNKTNSGIHWFVASSGSEATADVSAETVRLRVVGF